MNVSCCCANITMLGVFFGFSGSFSTVIASIKIPSARIPSMYFTKYFANAVQQDGQSLGQIAVVNFQSTTSLTKVGSTCFQNSDPKNPPAPAANVAVQQGKLEGSNVPVAEAAMRLVGVKWMCTWGCSARNVET